MGFCRHWDAVLFLDDWTICPQVLRLRIWCAAGWAWRALVNQLKTAYGIRLLKGRKRKDFIATFYPDICNSACV